MVDEAILPHLAHTVSVTLKGAQFRKEANSHLDH